jgi:heptosyltransferase-3
MRRLPKSEVTRILLPRFDTLGDLVLLEGFLAALCGQFPQARVTLMVRRVFSDLACLFPDSLEWLTIDFDPHKNPPEVPLGRALLAGLGDDPWDFVLATAHNRTWADDLIAAAMNQATKLAIGTWEEKPEHYRKVFGELGLGADCPYSQLVCIDKHSHETEKYQALWNALAEGTTLPEPVLKVSDYQSEAARQILEAVGMRPGQFFICCPAGTHKVSIKAWPAERFAEMIAWIESAYSRTCLVIGHQLEAETVGHVIDLAERRGAHPKAWLGRDGELPLLAALLAFASFYLGNDTGPMHMAAALQIPVIGIFGGGTWPRFLARGRQSTAIAGDMPCFGCDWNCLFGDAPCLRLIAVEDVRGAVQGLFEGLTAETSGARVLRASKRLEPEAEWYVARSVDTHRKLFQELAGIEKDRAARLEVIRSLERQLATSEEDRLARLEMIQKLTARLSEVEADRSARLELIEKTSKEMAVVEADRAARLRVIEEIDKRLKATQLELERIKSCLPAKILIKLGIIPQ